MLELAKIIFSRTNTKQMKLKVADAYMRLGEVGLETGRNRRAKCKNLSLITTSRHPDCA